MPIDLDLTQLRYFKAIARSGTLTAAALDLGVSQPALTTAVQRLEARLKTTLLLRSRSGVSLTSTGRILLEHADEVLGAVARAEQRIHGLETEATGAFAIGCHESLGAYFLPSFMPAFLRAHPGVALSLWNGTSAGVFEAVVRRDVEFGLVVNAARHPDVVLVPLFRDAVDVFVEAAGMPELDASTRDAPPETVGPVRDRIGEGPLIYAARVAQSRALVSRMAERGLVPSRVLECGDLEQVKALALAGLGVALLPRRVAAYGHPGRLRRLHPGLPFIPDVISLVFRGDLHRTRATGILKSALVDHGQVLDGEFEE